MGDMADYHLDQLIDEWGEDYFDYDEPRSPKSIICKFCGMNGLRWKKLPDKKWRLFEKYGMHTCKQEKEHGNKSS